MPDQKNKRLLKCERDIKRTFTISVEIRFDVFDLKLHVLFLGDLFRLHFAKSKFRAIDWNQFLGKLNCVKALTDSIKRLQFAKCASAT